MDKLTYSLRIGDFEEAANSVFVVDMFSKEHCQEILDEFENEEKWNVAKVSISKQNKSGMDDIVGVVDTARRNAFNLTFKDYDMSKKPKTLQSLIQIQKQVSLFTTSEFGLEFNQFGNEQLIRYPEGGLFKAHTDAHKYNSHRAFTIILYLNDDFEGGETDFPDLNYKCKPESGRVLIFLSTELHCGLPIYKGEKNIIVFWGFYPGNTSGSENKSNYFNPEIH